MPGISRWRAHRNEGGAAVVEFALIVPILFLLVFGIIQYGLYFMAMQGGSDIARSAARTSSAGKPATCAEFRSRVRAQIDSLTGNSSSATATITRSYQSDPAPGVQIGDTVVVKVSFTSFDLRLPFLPFIQDGRVTQSAQSRVDYVTAQPETCS